ncbi:MAG: aspartate carbamoyltransferase catalytic subunit [Fibrobacterota bacterium]
MALKIKHLLGLHGVGKEDITEILDAARGFQEILERQIKKVPTLRGKTIVNLFYENSTRTLISFELAETRLSGDVVNFSTSTSSVKKGETLKDTIRNIAAMKIDMVVVRHASAGVPKYLTECTDAVIINAGDGANEHPTQALLDMLTMRDHFGKLAGLKVVIIGDIAHSRVARSNIWGLTTMGADVWLCGPETLLPGSAAAFGKNVHITSNIEKALHGADVVMALRIQLERNAGSSLPSLNEYRALYGLTPERLTLTGKSDYLVMHPGPINRGIEINTDAADGNKSVILRQVTNGVAARMAVLYLLGGGAENG